LSITISSDRIRTIKLTSQYYAVSALYSAYSSDKIDDTDINLLQSHSHLLSSTPDIREPYPTRHDFGLSVYSIRRVDNVLISVDDLFGLGVQYLVSAAKLPVNE
jgi:hypothetical protein